MAAEMHTNTTYPHACGLSPLQPTPHCHNSTSNGHVILLAASPRLTSSHPCHLKAKGTFQQQFWLRLKWKPQSKWHLNSMLGVAPIWNSNHETQMSMGIQLEGVLGKAFLILRFKTNINGKCDSSADCMTAKWRWIEMPGKCQQYYKSTFSLRCVCQAKYVDAILYFNRKHLSRKHTLNLSVLILVCSFLLNLNKHEYGH